MTVLSACQSALLRLVGKKPATVFSSQDQTAIEIADLITEVGTDIMKGYDWQALTSVHTITADGVTTSFALPADYDRMVKASNIADPRNWAWGYSRILSVNDWITITSQGFAPTPGAWIILGGKFQFAPAPSTGQAAKFPYVSKNYARSGLGEPQSAFAADEDTFVLDERLLTLGLIWRWRAQKRLEYAEDMQTYEIALAQAQANDKGARVLRDGPRTTGNVSIAYPWPLGQ